MGFSGGLAVKNPSANSGDTGLIPGLGRCPGGGHGNPLQYSCLENPHGQRSLAGSSPWGHKRFGHDLVIEDVHEAGYYWAFPGLVCSENILVQGQILPLHLPLIKSSGLCPHDAPGTSENCWEIEIR